MQYEVTQIGAANYCGKSLSHILIYSEAGLQSQILLVQRALDFVNLPIKLFLSLCFHLSKMAVTYGCIARRWHSTVDSLAAGSHNGVKPAAFYPALSGIRPATS